MKKTVAFCTLGCKVNQYESEAVLEQFLKHGYEERDFSQKADVYVVNTCTVTHLSDRKSRQMIRRAKQLNPDSVLVVMGCYAQVSPEEIQKIPYVDILVGTTGKSQVLKFVENFLEEKRPTSHVEALGKDCAFEPLSIDGSGQGHTRAVLKVQDGCNQFCTYCMIPYARGRIRSRSLKESVLEAERLAKAGFCELVITGIHLASWGKDSGEGNLLDLLSALSAVEGIRRLRLGSLEPTLMTEDFVFGISRLPKVCRHFHLSLQSGCDETLKRMNRHYSARTYLEAVKRVRRLMPESAMTTDIMVGFPGETHEEFDESRSFLESLMLADAHIFKYSPRKGTVAAEMKCQIDAKLKEERSKTLIRLTEENKRRFLEGFVGKTMEVLFEQETEEGLYTGKTENYISVYVKSDEPLSGTFKQVTLLSVMADGLSGRIL